MMMDYRHWRLPLIGKIVTLVPLAPEHDTAVLALRNSPAARHFFDQPHETTLTMHRAFYADYCERLNDLYWVVMWNDQIVGANALYGITPDSAEKGRQIVEEKAARSAPIALETELLILDFAFRTLGIRQVTALVREDNAAVHVFNQRLGFNATGPVELRGRMYTRYSLAASDFDPGPFLSTIDYWANRFTRMQRESGTKPR